MATYNAESALARLLAAHYSRADDEARSLLRETFRALAALCEELTATETTYPGTDLKLVYSVKDTP